MCRVSKKARIADSAASVYVLPPHYLSVISILPTLLMPRFSLPSSCISALIGVTAYYPLVCSCIMSSGSLVAISVREAWLVTITLILWLTGLNPTDSFSCISYRHCAVSACELLLFHFYFVLAYTYLFSAKLRSGCLFKFRPCVDCLRPWTMIFP